MPEANAILKCTAQELEVAEHVPRNGSDICDAF